MSDLSDIVLVRVGDEVITARDLLYLLKIDNEFDRLKDLITDIIVRNETDARGITVTEADLQAGADRFRAANGLSRAADTHSWLERRRMTVDDLARKIERKTLRDKLKLAIADEYVHHYFVTHRSRFDRARLRQIVVSEEGVAYELLSQLEEDEATFDDLQRHYSVDTMHGDYAGHLGVVTRRDLSAEIGDAVFSGSPDDVVGPFSSDQGWHLLQVQALFPAELNDGTRARIVDVIFEEWLLKCFRQANITMPIFEML